MLYNPMMLFLVHFLGGQTSQQGNADSHFHPMSNQLLQLNLGKIHLEY